MEIRPRNVEEYQRAGGALLEGGAPIAAYDTVAEGLGRFPGDVRLRQLQALALARSGASRQANAVLRRLVSERHVDEETLGMLARTHKDMWAEGADEAERRRHLRLAYRCYRESYRRFGGTWSGINAATLALVLGDGARAKALARLVRDACLEQSRASDGATTYWLPATLGEAALILGERSEAEDWYGRATTAAGRRWGDIVSMRRNARLVLRHLDADESSIDACFPVPRVAVFAGHLIDHPARPEPRFPPWLEPAVRLEIERRLAALKIGVGYASAACGGDMLFLEGLLASHGEVHVVLPYDRDEFLRDSVDLEPGGHWPARYTRVLADAQEVLTASDHRIAEGSLSYEYAFRLLDGAAALRADELDTPLACIAVWDGRPGDGPGGTASAVASWRRAHRHVEIIDVGEMLRREPATRVGLADARSVTATDAASTPEGRAPDTLEPQLVGLLFADVQGFSKLTERQLPLFVEHFLGAVAKELAAAPEPPVLRNTWGDGLFCVFTSLRAAGLVALRLCDMVSRTDWTALGFSTALSIRVGLHAGPAFSCVDPVTGRRNYLGAHVSRAARIEPVTPPGRVYASAAFAALARAEQIQEFRCAYVGRTPLAKDAGTFPTYVVHARGSRK